MNSRLALRFFMIVFVGLCTANCATITRGTTNQIQITSEPTDVDVRTSNGHSCKSPCTLTVDRKAEFVVTFRKDGFKETSIPVGTRVAGAGVAGFAGNILIGGIVGMAADAVTGASLEQYPNPVHAMLEQERSVVQPSRNKNQLKKKKPVSSSSRSSGDLGIIEEPLTQ